MLQFSRIDRCQKIYDCNMPRGDTGEIVLEFEDYEPQDGDKIVFRMAKDLNADEADLEKNVEAFDGNVAIIRFLTSDTADFQPGIYYYVCRLFKADGSIDTFIEKSIFEVEVS